MSKIIYCTREIPQNGIQLLKDNGYIVDVGNFKKPPTKKDLIKALKKKNYEAVISFLTDIIDEDIFNACPNVKIFANYSVGFNNLDIKVANERGIVLTNTPGCSFNAVAEHTVALILALTTRLVESNTFVKNGKFKGWDPNLFIGTDLTGKTIGLIGVGEIGSKVAEILAKGFNCKIIFSEITKKEKIETEFNAKHLDIDTVCKESDIISLHVPLLASTHHLINKERLTMMKKTALLINTSRGPVIDEIALTDALVNGIIKGVGLDVYEYEPKITKKLLKLSNVVLTSHIASARNSVREKMSEIVAQNLISFFETGKAMNEIKIL